MTSDSCDTHGAEVKHRVAHCAVSPPCTLSTSARLCAIMPGSTRGGGASTTLAGVRQTCLCSCVLVLAIYWSLVSAVTVRTLLIRLCRGSLSGPSGGCSAAAASRSGLPRGRNPCLERVTGRDLRYGLTSKEDLTRANYRDKRHWTYFSANKSPLSPFIQRANES